MFVCVCVSMHTYMYENNINRDIRKIGCDDVDSIHLLQCRVQCVDSVLWKWLFHVGFNI